MKKLFLSLLFLPISVSWAQIASGPMVGYSDYLEVGLWVQTEQAAKVKFVYWEQGSPQKTESTEEVQTEAQSAFVAKAVANKVLPGKKYDYAVHVNGQAVSRSYPLSFQTQELYQWRKDAPNFKFAFGSCVYINEPAFDRPGRGYGSGYGIFTKIAEMKPDFMIWGGDNVYYRETDWNTRTGLNHRFSHGRAPAEMQPLLGSTHHYAIWDDHDYGPNDSDRGYWMKNTALEVFKNFWFNPNYIFHNEGITGTFQWADVQFFLLDDRWWRAPNEPVTSQRDYFGKKQVDWLMDALSFSRATFKIIVTGGQVVNPSKVFENYANYEEERSNLLNRIAEANIKGVLFFSGDRHHTVLQRLDRPGKYPLYELTSSALTSGASKPVEAEKNAPMVPGTLVTVNNFSMLETMGTRANRALKISVYDAVGALQWTKEIKAEELK
jgi:alkaline phosphatase D